MSHVLPPSYETEVDHQGLKYKIFYKIENNKLIKVTQTIKVYIETKKINKNVLRRKKMKKFNINDDQNLTIQDKFDVQIVSPDKDEQEEKINSSIDFDDFQKKQIKRKLERERERENKIKEIPKNKYVIPQKHHKFDLSSVKISNLSVRTKEDDLYNLCKYFGNIKNVNIVKDRETGISKCFGFVNFYDQKHAFMCIQNLNKYAYDNLILEVKQAISK